MLNSIFVQRSSNWKSYQHVAKINLNISDITMAFVMKISTQNPLFSSFEHVISRKISINICWMPDKIYYCKHCNSKHWVEKSLTSKTWMTVTLAASFGSRKKKLNILVQNLNMKISHCLPENVPYSCNLWNLVKKYP